MSRKTEHRPRSMRPRQATGTIKENAMQPVQMCGTCFQLQWNYMAIIVGGLQQQNKLPNLMQLTEKALNVRCGEHAPEPPVDTGLVVPHLAVVPGNGRVG